MGTWALPFNQQAVDTLREIFSQPAPLNEKTKSKLYNVIGNDNFFDKLDSIGFHPDIRNIIREELLNILTDYDSNPWRYFVKLPVNIKEELESLVSSSKK